MKMQQIKFEGYIMDYEDLEKVAPKEFNEFKDSLEGVFTYFKLQDEDLLEEVVTVQNVIGYLHKESDILYDELEEEDLEVVSQIKKPYKNLIKSVTNKAGLKMSRLFYSEAFNNVVVEFNRNQAKNEPLKVEGLKSLGVNFRFAEWVEDEWFEK